MKILVTGTAGFIGSHLALKLIEHNYEVVGLDSINDYYDTSLKYDRLKLAGINLDQINYNELIKSTKYKNYSFIQLDLADENNLAKLFKENKFDSVCNLAAQAGVRHSIKNPKSYISSNMIGFFNILESCRDNMVEELIFASSSSVYGLNESSPFHTNSITDHPMNLYAASKKSNEIVAHSYSHLYEIKTTGLRFFTVYGPWGRPDMALFLFTKAALNSETIDVYNFGEMYRDFTYIDDIVDGIKLVIDNPAEPSDIWDPKLPKSSISSAPYKIYNIGNNNPVKLTDFIFEIEKRLGLKIKQNFMDIQPGDVPSTYANVDDLENKFGYKSKVNIKEGIKNFISWYLKYYQND